MSEAKQFDPTDPHGFHEGHHEGHVILSIPLLLGVLIALLAFTILTVFAAQAELWVAHTFDIKIPQWVNVIVAMSIATVKATLVAMFFMQLKYDSPLNSIVFCFCLFGVALFLGFASLDLYSRDAIYSWKKGHVVEGGTGSAGGGAVSRTVPPEWRWWDEERNTWGYYEFDGSVAYVIRPEGLAESARPPKPKESIQGPIVQYVKEKTRNIYLAKHDGDVEAWEAYVASHHHGDHHDTHSTGNQSRPVDGGLFVSESTHGHDDGHAGGDAASH